MTQYFSTIAATVLGCCAAAVYAQPFTLAVIGDSQFDWSCESEDTQTTPYCESEINRKKSTSTQGTETNQLVIDRVGEMAELTNFKGLKILVSVVRFRPRPPVSMRPSARKCSGAFLHFTGDFYISP